MVDTMGRTALRSVGWSVLDKWGTRLTSLVVVLVLGRILDADSFGIVALATVYTTLALVFVDSGFGRSLVQKHHLNDTDKSTAFWVNVALGTSLSAITLLLAPVMAELFDVPTLAPVLQVLSISLFLNGLSSTPAALLERDFQFKRLAMRRACGTISGAVTAIILAVLGFGVWSLVFQSIIASTISTLVLWFSSEWRPSLRFSVESFKSLKTVGISIMGIELIAYFNSQADKLLIGAYMDTEMLGYYYIALQITTVITSLFSSVFGNISLTTFSRVQNDEHALAYWFKRLTQVSSFTAIPVFAVVAASSPILIPLLLGSQWEGSVPVMQILALLGVINSAIMFDRNLLIAAGHGRRALRMTLGQAILGIALILPSLQFGILGVAVAVVLRQYIFWPFRIRLVKKAIDLPICPYLRGWAVPATIGLASFALASIAPLVATDISDLFTLFLQVGVAGIVTVVAYLLVIPKAFTKIRKMIREKTLV